MKERGRGSGKKVLDWRYHSARWKKLPWPSPTPPSPLRARLRKARKALTILAVGGLPAFLYIGVLSLARTYGLEGAHNAAFLASALFTAGVLTGLALPPWGDL